MRSTTILCSVLVFILSAISFGRIEEATRLSDALKEVDAGTLLIFDLDNTLIEPKQTLGSDQWVDQQIAIKEADYKKKSKGDQEAHKLALHDVLQIWKKVQYVSEVLPAEPTTAQLIQEKQAAGVHTMGLTARPTDLIERSIYQLKSIGVDLAANTVSKRKFLLKPDMDPDMRSEFRSGILFSGNNPKGQMLVDFLKEKTVLDFQPKKIIFVDDKRTNVESVEKSLNEVGIPHVCYRYGALDAKVKSYDPRIAEVQLQYFERPLTDDAAQKLLPTKTN